MVTIKDLAKAAGVSPAAVSKALHGHPDISQATRQRILALAAEMNYRPNVLARSLVKQRTTTLGLFVLSRGSEGFLGQFAGPIIGGLMDCATAYGYDIVLFSTPGNGPARGLDADGTAGGEPPASPPPVSHVSYLDLCRERQVEGALILGLRLDDPALPELRESPLPLVLHDVALTGPHVSCIGCDNSHSTFEAVSFLLKLGHRRIGFINGHAQAAVSRERLEGYRQALQAFGVEPDPCLEAAGDFSQESGYRAAAALLELRPRPTALMAASDLMAIGALEALRVQALRVPEDVSLVGFDDIPAAQHLQPPLTTVRQDRYQTGWLAGKTLIEATQGKMVPARIVVPAQLVIRQSTASPAAEARSA